MPRLALLLMVVLACTLALPSVAADKTDVSGEWQLTIETDNGTFTPTAIFAQDGDKLTGTYKGRFGESKLTGSVKEKAIEWQVTIDIQGQSVTLAYKGEVTADDAMKGSVQMGDFGNADWTAKRAPKK